MTPEPSPGRAAATDDQGFERWRQALLATPAPAPLLSEIGHVTEVGNGVAIVGGLARALADELVAFAGGVRGLALDLEPGRLGVVLLGPAQAIALGEAVHRTR